MATTQFEPKTIDQEEQQRLNAELGRRINRETRADPDSPYAGKFVVIANGEIVAVMDSLDEVAAYIKAAGLKLGESYCVEASADPDSTMWISPFLEIN